VSRPEVDAEDGFGHEPAVAPEAGDATVGRVRVGGGQVVQHLDLFRLGRGARGGSTAIPEREEGRAIRDRTELLASFSRAADEAVARVVLRARGRKALEEKRKKGGVRPRDGAGNAQRKAQTYPGGCGGRGRRGAVGTKRGDPDERKGKR